MLFSEGNTDPFLTTNVEDSITRWNFYSPDHKVDLTSYLFRLSSGNFFFDPAVAWVPQHSQTSRVPGTIFLTSGNHLRNAPLLASLIHAPVLASSRCHFSVASACFQPVFLESMDRLPGGWEWFPIDGGPSGETVFLHRELGYAVFGDALVNLEGRQLELLPEKYCADLHLMKNSLRDWFAKYGSFVRSIFMAHGRPLLDASGIRDAVNLVWAAE
jgi:hypothetical protein